MKTEPIVLEPSKPKNAEVSPLQKNYRQLKAKRGNERIRKALLLLHAANQDAYLAHDGCALGGISAAIHVLEGGVNITIRPCDCGENR